MRGPDIDTFKGVFAPGTSPLLGLFLSFLRASLSGSIQPHHHVINPNNGKAASIHLCKITWPWDILKCRLSKQTFPCKRGFMNGGQENRLHLSVFKLSAQSYELIKPFFKKKHTLLLAVAELSKAKDVMICLLFFCLMFYMCFDQDSCWFL